MGRSLPPGQGRALLALGLGLGGFGCSRAEPASPPGAKSATAATPRASAPASAVGSAPGASSAPSASSAAAASSGSSPAASARPESPGVVVEKTDAGVPGLKLGELVDITTAGPATATPEGVVMVTKDDQVLVAKRSPSARPEQAKLATLDAPPDAFSALGRGPSVARGHAYWISHGRLVRQALGAARELEVLVDDARDRTRTSAVELDGRVAVAFLGRADHEGTSHARLWVEGMKPLDLTPDGAGASSVALTRAGDHLVAAAIDGRSAMTPLHARTVRVTPEGIELGEDVVAWVGGPARTWTETFVGAEAGRAWAHVPLERDITHFGLASVDLGRELHMDSEASFFEYPNGIDLVPVAMAELCGHAHVAFVRPTTAVPRSPQELVLVRLGTQESVTLANARGFAGVSLAGFSTGGLLAYVADGRTWARSFGCH